MNESLFHAFAKVERSHWWFTARREIVLAVAARHIPPGGSVLDVGCGTGFFLEGARGRYRVAGVDPSPTAVALCRGRGLHEVTQGSADDLSAVGDRPFEGVFFLDVIEHLDDDLHALREASRHLAPGGVIIITVPAYGFLWSRHDVTNQHRRRYTRRSLRDLLTSAGLVVEQLTYYNCYLFPLAATRRLAARLTGGWPTDDALRPPHPWINSLMRRVFESEKGRVAGSGTADGYPFGLSLLAVAHNRRGAA